jgi:hypothetical protein
VVAFSKFTEGGWLIVLTVPALVLVMERVNRTYGRIGERLELGRTPTQRRGRISRAVIGLGTVLASSWYRSRARVFARRFGEDAGAELLAWPGHPRGPC